MDAALKTRLAEIKKAKRGVLLKDVSPSQLLIACDHWEDFCEKQAGEFHPGDGYWIAYVKYAKSEQIAALQSRLPHVAARIYSPDGRMRIVSLFSRAALEHVFKCVVNRPVAYISGTSWNLLRAYECCLCGCGNVRQHIDYEAVIAEEKRPKLANGKRFK